MFTVRRTSTLYIALFTYTTLFRSATNATLGSPTTDTITIIEPTLPTVEFHASTQSINYDGHTLTVEVDLSASSRSEERRVGKERGGQGGTSPDYNTNSSTGERPAGCASVLFKVPTADAVVWGLELLRVLFDSATNATLGSPTTDTITIIEPTLPTVEFHASTQSINYDGHTLTVEVDLSASS